MESLSPELLQETGLIYLGSGKVRELYRWKDELWLIATDRLSAFDCLLEPPLEGKGRLLTALSRFWFEKTASWCPNHVISFDLPREVPIAAWEGRVTRARQLEIIPLECVARGYLAGSGWKEYAEQGTVGGFPLPAGLQQADPLPEPLFTPATKATEGHDENVTADQAIEIVGAETYEILKEKTLELYRFARSYAAERGIIIADTKFEFGRDREGTLVLADEVLTPDSSRFWPADAWKPGESPPSFDKQFVRDYLESLSWDKTPPAPCLPAEIVERTLSKYQEALERLVGGA